jgi:hypothetical protein
MLLSTEHSCGDSMGEQEYKKLEDEVGDLKETVEDQANEMRVIEVDTSHVFTMRISMFSLCHMNFYIVQLARRNLTKAQQGILLMSMGFFKGDSAQSLKAVASLQNKIA